MLAAASISGNACINDNIIVGEFEAKPFAVNRHKTTFWPEPIDVVVTGKVRGVWGNTKEIVDFSPTFADKSMAAEQIVYHL
ncbi:MAG: hypothetical protein WAO83_09950 [Fuerstiella sp.]